MCCEILAVYGPFWFALFHVSGQSSRYIYVDMRVRKSGVGGGLAVSAYRAMLSSKIRTVFSMHCIIRRFPTVFAFATIASGLNDIMADRILCANGARVLTMAERLFRVAVTRVGSLLTRPHKIINTCIYYMANISARNK